MEFNYTFIFIGLLIASNTFVSNHSSEHHRNGHASYNAWYSERCDDSKITIKNSKNVEIIYGSKKGK